MEEFVYFLGEELVDIPIGHQPYKRYDGFARDNIRESGHQA